MRNNDVSLSLCKLENIIFVDISIIRGIFYINIGNYIIVCWNKMCLTLSPLSFYDNKALK